MDEAAIKAQIVKLTAERDEFIQQANAQTGFLNGQIRALTWVLEPPPPPEPPKDA